MTRCRETVSSLMLPPAAITALRGERIAYHALCCRALWVRAHRAEVAPAKSLSEDVLRKTRQGLDLSIYRVP